MEVTNNFIATVYYRVDVDALGQTIAKLGRIDENGEAIEVADHGQQVKWKVDFRIKRFPRSLALHTSVPYLFSPDFTYQLDFNYRDKQIEIKESRTQFVHLYVSKDLINTEWNM